jgi:hypothetical protein
VWVAIALLAYQAGGLSIDARDFIQTQLQELKVAMLLN